VADYRAKQAAVGFLVGQACEMKGAFRVAEIVHRLLDVTA
jgi:hypothetical protein